jgi:hypothetical protein
MSFKMNYKKKYFMLSIVIVMLLNIIYAIIYPVRGGITDLEFALVSGLLPLFSIVCLSFLFLTFSIRKIISFALLFFLTYLVIIGLLNVIEITNLGYELFTLFFIVISLSIIYFSSVLFNIYKSKK